MMNNNNNGRGQSRQRGLLESQSSFSQRSHSRSYSFSQRSTSSQGSQASSRLDSPRNRAPPEAQHPNQHSFVVCGTVFCIDKRYKLIKPIGHGAYGVVCSAMDTKTGETVAIKKITKVFGNDIETKRTIREIKLLARLSHENVIALKDVMTPTNKDHFEDIYMVSDLMDTDLHQIIASPQPLSDDHIQYFIYQVLRGLKFIHSSNVLHRDLKPSNVLLNGNCDLKICDFGLARVAEAEDSCNGFMTEYVATRWYRAPEIMLSWKEYTRAVDIWSVGCIFAELLGRKPLFPGRDYMHQLHSIIHILGTPTDDDSDYIASDKAKQYVRQLSATKAVAWTELFPQARPEALDLLSKMLTFAPHKRITVEEALAHPYLKFLHDLKDEPTSDCTLFFAWEQEMLNPKRLRDILYGEVEKFAEKQGRTLAPCTEGGSHVSPSTQTAPRSPLLPMQVVIDAPFPQQPTNLPPECDPTLDRSPWDPQEQNSMDLYQ